MWKKTWPKWPWKITKEVLQKLEEWFILWFTDTEACLFADVPSSTFYDYCKLNPDFSEKKELLKKQPNMTAKKNWIDKINKWDYIASKEWLERKAKDEFSLKQEVDQNNTWEIKINVVNYKSE